MNKPVILAVDDDHEVLGAVERDLRRRYRDDYRVVAASSGKEALSTVEELKRRGTPVALFLVDQRMPVWIPPNPVFAYRMYRGTLEVVVGEDGAVESRAMSEPAFPSYDRELLDVAQRWKYTPAIKDGRPVKYRKVIAVTLGG